MFPLHTTQFVKSPTQHRGSLYETYFKNKTVCIHCYHVIIQRNVLQTVLFVSLEVWRNLYVSCKFIKGFWFDMHV